MNKKYLLYVIIPVATFAILGGVALADTKTNKINPMTNLVNAIAQKFNLNVNDVQAVFDEQRTETEVLREQGKIKTEEEMIQKFKERINKLVSSGKLTQDQADRIFAKITGFKTLKASLKDKTKEEAKAIMKTSMESLKQWAKDNNIPLGYVQFGGMPGHRGAMMGKKLTD